MSSDGIAPKAYACVGRFDELCRLLPDSDHNARPTIIDQLGRFKIWAGNIGAFQELSTPSSLEHRLREAPKVGAQVAELLDDLEETLREVLSIVSGDQPNRINSSQDAGLEGSTTADDDETASVRSDQSQPLSELEELLESSSDTITSLFKISVLIRNATTRDRYAKAAKSQGLPFDAHFDIGHVGHKFPRIRQTSWLEKRLGKAITQRRQYLRYCRQHRDRLETQHTSKSFVGDAIEKERPPSALGERRDESSQATKSYLESTKAPSTQAITTASTLMVNNLDKLDDISDEVQSQTSYATSANEDDSSCTIRIPPLPDEAFRGLPFECPYCWGPQLIKTRREWKKHVYQDLKPYVCTFEECDLKMFADRSTWFSHELQAHRVEWCCPFCSHIPLPSLKSFENHLHSRHAQKFPNYQLRALTETCQQSVNRISPQDCPFCDEWAIKLRDMNPGMSKDSMVVTPAQFQHHVGSHMEQLALFALPKDHGDAADSTGVAAGQGERSDSEFGSQASYELRDNPPLHVAAFEGLEAEVLYLLQDGAMIDSIGETWGDVLTAAAAGRHPSMVQLLLDHGATFTRAPTGESHNEGRQLVQSSRKPRVPARRDLGSFRPRPPASRYGFNTMILATDNEDERIVHMLQESAAKTGLREPVGSELDCQNEAALPITAEEVALDAAEDVESLSPIIDRFGSPQNYLGGPHSEVNDREDSASFGKTALNPQESMMEEVERRISDIQSRDAKITPGLVQSVVQLITKLTGVSIRMIERIRAFGPNGHAEAWENIKSQLALMMGTLKRTKRQIEEDMYTITLPNALNSVLSEFHWTLGKLDAVFKMISTFQDGTSGRSERVRTFVTSNKEFLQISLSLKTNHARLALHYRKVEQKIAIRRMPLEIQGWIDDQLISLEDLAGNTSPMPESVHPSIDLLNRLLSRDPKSTELPQGFMVQLDDQIIKVLKDTKSQWFEDAHARRSLEAFSKASSELSFRERMEDDKSVDHLLLLFFAGAAHETLDDHLWRPIVDEQLANFVYLILAVLENHSWARDRPELTSHLGNLGSRLQISAPMFGEFTASEIPHGSAKDGNDGTISTEGAVKTETLENVFAGSNRWLYLDIGRKLRGPWSDWQMYEWYAAGLLPNELLVREVGETDFGPLSQFIEKIRRSRVPENIVLNDMPPGLVNIVPKKTAGIPDSKATLQHLIQFTGEIGLLLDYQDLVSQRVVNIQQFFLEVLKMGGSTEITAKQQWAIVAASLGFPVMHCQTAAQSLRIYWDLHLSEYGKSFEIWQEQQRERPTSQRSIRLEAHQASEDELKPSNYQPTPTSRLSKVTEDVAPGSAPLEAPSFVYTEPEADDPSIFVMPNTVCRRRGCNALSTAETNTSRKDEICFYHPGQALYHEESKWWTCCNSGVMDSDVFAEVEGCRRVDSHLFVGSEIPKLWTTAATPSMELPSLSHDDFDHADSQVEVDRDLAHRIQTFEYQQDSDRELAVRMQESKTLHHIKSRSVIGATSLSGGSKARQGTQGDLELSVSPELQLTKLSSSDTPYSQQNFGPSAPEGYRYQCSDCTGRRKALLIGIESSGIESSDIQKTFAILLKDYGYKKENIIMLSSQPKKRDILSAMAWLVKDAQTNDCLFFQYSGNGHPKFEATGRHLLTETGPAGQSLNLDTHGRPTLDDVIYPIDSKIAGHITNYEIFQVMVQPLKPGVRLTAIFDGFYDTSPLKLPYIYTSQAVLAEADFSTKASQGVVARFSSNARKILRAMSSSTSLQAPKVPDSDMQDLSRVTRTSPADVVVFHAARHSDADAVDATKWSTASAFFHVYSPNRYDSYAGLLSRIDTQLPFKSTIHPRISCCHPLDMNKHFIM